MSDDNEHDNEKAEVELVKAVARQAITEIVINPEIKQDESPIDADNIIDILTKQVSLLVMSDRQSAKDLAVLVSKTRDIALIMKDFLLMRSILIGIAVLLKIKIPKQTYTNDPNWGMVVSSSIEEVRHNTSYNMTDIGHISFLIDQTIKNLTEESTALKSKLGAETTKNNDLLEKVKRLSEDNKLLVAKKGQVPPWLSSEGNFVVGYTTHDKINISLIGEMKIGSTIELNVIVSSGLVSVDYTWTQESNITEFLKATAQKLEAKIVGCKANYKRIVDDEGNRRHSIQLESPTGGANTLAVSKEKPCIVTSSKDANTPGIKVAFARKGGWIYLQDIDGVAHQTDKLSKAIKFEDSLSALKYFYKIVKNTASHAAPAAYMCQVISTHLITHDIASISVDYQANLQKYIEQARKYEFEKLMQATNAQPDKKKTKVKNGKKITTFTKPKNKKNINN